MSAIASKKTGHAAAAAELNRLLSTNLELTPTDRRNGLQQPLETGKIADLLRSSSATLKDLGIGKVRNAHTFMDTFHWEQLRACLREAKADDALVIFKAMAIHLSEHSMVDVSPVMTDALQQPWRMQAIETAPALFQMVRTQKQSVCWRKDQQAHNAFHALAAVENVDQSSVEDIRACLRALKNMGLQDFPNPENQLMSLHMAALCHGPESFRVFVSEFPDQMESMSKEQMRPLHVAATSSHVGNVRILLEAGAEPKATNSKMRTPLHEAASNQRYENAMTLIGSAAYFDDEVDVAASSLHDRDQAARLRGYHAAVKASHAVDGGGSGNVLVAKPL